MRAVLAACIVLLLEAPALPDAASHLGKAIRLMQDRLFSEAAAEFEQALAADPNNDEVRIRYATCLFAQERNAEARKQFEIERQRLGDRPGLNYYLGRLDLRANDFASAIQKLAPLEKDPALSDVALYLGVAYMSAGQPARALECLERAARQNPRDPQVHYRLGRVYSMAGRTDDADREYELYRDWQENQRVAERDGHECKDALRTQPLAQARIVCQRIADPNDSHRLILLGELYSENGAFADAVEPLRQAVKLDPESFEAWNGLGQSLFRLKRYQEALPALRRASRLNPQFFVTLTLLASTLHALGDDAAALPVLEQAHKLNPDDAQVTARLEQLRAALKGKR
ncbi:MAG: tetratricopeptide repeat protein [Bryobacteraceae bacterium]|jgi:tetratricopeptide (TPR) repeat protein